MQENNSIAPAGKESLRNVRMTVEYDGTRYVGWQYQINGISIQQRVEEALAKTLGHDVRVTVAGRTDAGVHASGQVINFRTASILPAKAIQVITLKYLPEDIVATFAEDVAPTFDSRRSARLRWYKYHLFNRTVFPAANRQFMTHVRGDLDFGVMNEVCDIFAGNHDFSAFRSIYCQATRTYLSMRRPRIVRLDNERLVIDYMARSFLHNMVRVMTGAMISCGRGHLAPQDVRTMLETGHRPVQAVTLAPTGLFLHRVFYEDIPEGEYPE